MSKPFLYFVLFCTWFSLWGCSDSPEPDPPDPVYYELVPGPKAWLINAQISDNTRAVFFVRDLSAWEMPRPWKATDTLELVLEYKLVRK